MTPKTLHRLREYSLHKWPNEAVALLSYNKKNGEEEIIFCENVARDKRRYFAIDDNIYIKELLKDNYIIIFHSHCYNKPNYKLDNFSPDDIEKSEECGWPFLMFNSSTDKWNYYEPESRSIVDLLNRPFVKGVWSCYTLVKDYYKINYNIDLNYYFSPDDIKEFDLFDKHFQEEGFEEISLEKIEKGSLILFKIGRSKFSNHIAVYLGDNTFLHHPLNKLSRYEILNHKYIKRINKILKYNG